MRTQGPRATPTPLTSLVSLALSSCGLLLLACGPASPPGELVSSNKQRVTTAAPDEDLGAALSGNHAFAVDIYRKLTSTSSNVVFSPYSITTALAMTYGGAQGATAKAFESTLHITLPPERFHRAMNTIDAALTSRGGAGRSLKLSVENQLFAQKGFSILPGFLDLMATEYGAGVRLLDFAKASEAARKAINEWVKANTESLIPELLQPSDVDSDTVLFLVNTVYFNAAWATAFPHKSTRPAPFELTDGSQVEVPTMAAEDISGGRATVDGTEVIELPYKGEQMSMVLLVPPSGQLSQFEARLSADELARHFGALAPATFALLMPKFAFSGRADMKQLLTELGLGVAFGDTAEFGALSPEPIAISRVVHQAIIRTNEDGTVAAAATGVGMERVSLPLYVTVNRPFLFFVRDRGTGAVVFMGRVVDPR